MTSNQHFFKDISHIFWDLDHTLWDYSTNSRLTIYELFEKHAIHQRIEHGPAVFHDTYSKHNDLAWLMYREGQIDKDALRKQRFQNTFLELGADPEGIAEIFEIEFVEICRSKPHLIEGAMEVLSFFEKTYRQHIITNGFKEALDHKILNSGIKHFFDTITNSEDSGYQKPNPEIFHIALNDAGATIENSVMIGDNLEADVLGAYQLGMKCVYFNPANQNSGLVPKDILTISKLKELLT